MESASKSSKLLPKDILMPSTPRVIQSSKAFNNGISYAPEPPWKPRAWSVLLALKLVKTFIATN